MKDFSTSKKPIAIILVLLVLIAGGIAVHAASAAPGSEADPVVTKSYVDSVAGGGGSYKIVQMTAGQTILGGEGTEMILRAGEAYAVVPGTNGISDMTDGVDLMYGANIGMNHLLLVPRNDGRGIYAVTDVYIMVRGSYTLQ